MSQGWNTEVLARFNRLLITKLHKDGLRTEELNLKFLNSDILQFINKKFWLALQRFKTDL
jgi:hypothetical protein